jgi:hypothetical protein
VAGAQRDAIALVSAEEPIAVVLDLVQPVGPAGRAADEERQGRMKPAGRVRRERAGEVRHNMRGNLGVRAPLD